MRIRRIRVDERRIRKEKVADSKIPGYVWKGPDTTYISNKTDSSHILKCFFYFPKLYNPKHILLNFDEEAIPNGWKQLSICTFVKLIHKFS